jgi:hypothetical protein
LKINIYITYLIFNAIAKALSEPLRLKLELEPVNRTSMSQIAYKVKLSSKAYKNISTTQYLFSRHKIGF